MSNIIVNIKRVRDDGPSEKSISEYILNNLDIIEMIDIRDLANKTYSSPAAITRYVKKIGYKGFIEFKYSLASYIKNINTNNKFESNFSVFENVKKVIADNENFISQEIVDAFVDCILKNESAMIFANGGTYTIAYDLALKMQRFGIMAMAISDVVVQQSLISVPEKKDRTIYIIISSSGETKSLVKIAEDLKSKNKSIISITCNSKNKIRSLSTQNISFNNDIEDLSQLVNGNRIILLIINQIIIENIIIKNKIDINRIIKTVK